MTDKTCPSKEFKSVFNMQVNCVLAKTHTCKELIVIHFIAH